MIGLSMAAHASLKYLCICLPSFSFSLLRTLDWYHADIVTMSSYHDCMSLMYTITPHFLTKHICQYNPHVSARVVKTLTINDQWMTETSLA